jgi:hypothetical protein
LNLPCARGGLGGNGKHCPTTHNAAQTQEEAVLDQVARLHADGMAGVLGFDMVGSLALARIYGLSETVMAGLLVEAEAGLLEGLKEKRDRSADK